MSFEPHDYLRHRLVEAEYLIGRSAGLSYEVFAADETLRRAFVRSLQIVGEAAKKVPEDFKSRHPSVEWRAMAGMRDRLYITISAWTSSWPGTWFRHESRRCERNWPQFSRPSAPPLPFSCPFDAASCSKDLHAATHHESGDRPMIVG
jgi:uncharacterized protein with HEPN domain